MISKIVTTIFNFFMKYIINRLTFHQKSEMIKSALPKHKYQIHDMVTIGYADKSWMISGTFYDVYEDELHPMYALKDGKQATSYAPEHMVKIDLKQYPNMDDLIYAGLNSTRPTNEVLGIKDKPEKEVLVEVKYEDLR